MKTTLKLICRAGLIAAASTVCSGTALAAPPDYDLANVQGVEYFAGSTAARELLRKNGFVVSDPFYKQIFAPYIGNPLPIFITTDSAWHTYHVLLEEAVKQLEETQARRLVQFSRQLWEAAEAQAARGDPDFADLAAYARLGLALQDAGPAAKLPAPQQKLLATLRSGVGEVAAPVGFPLAAANFRAASFYSQSGALADYFAARQWYATVLFRLSDSRETRLALKLAALIQERPELAALWEKLSLPFDRLLAPAEDGDLRSYTAAAKKVLGSSLSAAQIAPRLAAMQKELEARLPDARVNDQLLLPDDFANFGKRIKGFRLLPPRRLPCATAFQNTTDPKIPGRQLPSGLDFLVASPTLRSAAGLRALEQAEGQAVVRAVQAFNCEPFPESLHGEAMRLLALLQKPLPASAPPALRTEAWADHQLWSQLGAWAEQRHTWALHTKLSTMYAGMADQPAGIVAPYPDFFAGLAQLTRQTATALEQSGGEPEFEARAVAGELLAQVQLIKRLNARMKAGRQSEEVNPEEMEGQFSQLSQLGHFLESYQQKEQTRPAGRGDFQEQLEAVESLARRAAAATNVAGADLEALRHFHGARQTALPMLKGLSEVCDRLAALAKKQLAGEPLTEPDNKWISDYGTTLARLHFYDGNSYLEPRDDFPMVTRVFANPATGMILYAGLARPQSLYVVVPEGGKLQLYQGAVLTYREFSRSAGEPLDDAAWRKLVSDGSTPPPPAFTRSFYAEAATSDLLRALRETEDPRAGHDRKEELQQLRARAQAADLTNLVDLLPVLIARDDHEAVTAVADTIARLPWKPLQPRFFDWLSKAAEEPAIPRGGFSFAPGPRSFAEVAAHILAQQPAEIEVEKLMGGFTDRPTLGRRLTCVLLSKLPKPAPAADAALLRAMQDADAGVRWQAALAIYQRGLNDPEAVAALTTRLGDTNEYVGGAAAYALGKLGARQAAAAIQARLKARNPNQGLSLEESKRQAEAVQGDDRLRLSGTFDLLRVDRVFIHPMPPRLPAQAHASRLLMPTLASLRRMGGLSLNSALIGALADLGGDSARDELARWLGSADHDAAVDALRKVDPRGLEPRLLLAALDRNADLSLRLDCLSSLAELQYTNSAKALATLLDDTAVAIPTPRQPELGLRVCDLAAAVIAQLQGWEVERRLLMDPSQRDLLVKKARDWAAEKK